MEPWDKAGLQPQGSLESSDAPSKRTGLHPQLAGGATCLSPKGGCSECPLAGRQNLLPLDRLWPTTESGNWHFRPVAAVAVARERTLHTLAHRPLPQ